MTEFKQLTDAEQIAETFGIVLGAASQNPVADDHRLSSIAEKMTHIVSAVATDEGDAEAAQERFYAAVEAGKTAAEDGRIDPNATEKALHQIEAEIKF
jgi:predicted transcriptional regulator